MGLIQGVTAVDDPRVLRRLDELAQQWHLPDEFPDRVALLLALVQASPHSLTTVREPAEAVEVHVADSLTGLAVPELRESARIADLGAGAGFPGLVLAAARPRSRVALVESVGKKASFMADAAARMGLANVEVVPQRVEQWKAGSAAVDVATARALAPLGVLLEYAAPLLRPGGALIAWKAQRDPQEESAARHAAGLLGMEPPAAIAVPGETRRERCLYLSHKVRDTPPGFPRRPGMARKRPLAP